MSQSCDCRVCESMWSNSADVNFRKPACRVTVSQGRPVSGLRSLFISPISLANIRHDSDLNIHLAECPGVFSILFQFSSTSLLSPPSSSTAVKHGPCLLTLEKKKKDPGFRNQVHEEISPYLLLGAQDQRLGAEEEQHPLGSTGTLPQSPRTNTTSTTQGLKETRVIFPQMGIADMESRLLSLGHRAIENSLFYARSRSECDFACFACCHEFYHF